jgi:hypothetical protein
MMLEMFEYFSSGPDRCLERVSYFSYSLQTYFAVNFRRSKANSVQYGVPLSSLFAAEM